MEDYNFGPCNECECPTTLLFRVRSHGEETFRVACRLHPNKHWRPATDEDWQLAGVDRLALPEMGR
jgi:hypothetical protein